MRPRSTLIAVVASLAVGAGLAACGGDDDGDETTATTPPAEEAGCEQVKPPKPKKVDLKKPRGDQGVAPGVPLTAVVKTSCGKFEIALDTTNSPKTASSFAHMAKKGLYDDTAFHRIVPGFVIQGGDPAGDGTGGPGYFVDEPPPPDIEYLEGVVAMAKTQVEPPGRSGSQFFVVTAADAGLPAQFAVLGEVSSGMPVVGRVESLGDRTTGDEGAPSAPVVIERVTIEGA